MLCVDVHDKLLFSLAVPEIKVACSDILRGVGSERKGEGRKKGWKGVGKRGKKRVGGKSLFERVDGKDLKCISACSDRACHQRNRVM